MFRTMYDKRDRVFCESGSGIKDEYQLRIIDGKYIPDKVGETDLYQYIQSHADSVDIHKILERCSMDGDYSILRKMPSEFMDVTDMPTNLADAFSRVKDAENYFNRMPRDIKDKYDNNFLSFLGDLGSDRFYDNVKKYVDSIKPENNDNEVKEE